MRWGAPRSLEPLMLVGRMVEHQLDHDANPTLVRGAHEGPFTVDAYHVSIRRDGRASVCEATVKVRVGDEAAHTVADGDGPVNALDAALRSALVKFYPQLERVKLTDYKVRIIDSAGGTAAKTRVLIVSGDGISEWGTVGVSENIIDASLDALVDSLEYGLVKDR